MSSDSSTSLATQQSIKAYVDSTVGGVSASQAQMETATSTAVYSSPGRQQFHPGHPKAWVVYNQLTGPSVAASYNVTSVSDDSLGNFTVTWDTDFSSTAYTTVASTTTAGGGNSLVGIGTNARAAGTCSFATVQLTSSLDRNGNSIAAFGDQA